MQIWTRGTGQELELHAFYGQGCSENYCLVVTPITAHHCAFTATHHAL